MGDVYYLGNRKAYREERDEDRLYAGNREYGLWVIIAALLIVIGIFGAFDIAPPQTEDMAIGGQASLSITLTEGER